MGWVIIHPNRVELGYLGFRVTLIAKNPTQPDLIEVYLNNLLRRRLLGLNIWWMYE